MGCRSSIDFLPRKVRRRLEWILTENNFIGYTELGSLLKERGYSTTRSSLQRFGYKMEQQLAWVRVATEAARLLAREAGNGPDDRSTGLITLVQTETMDILIRLQESQENNDPFARAKLLVAASKNIATLTHAPVSFERYQAEVRERVERAAAVVEKVTCRDGLSVEAVQALCREILGMVS